MTNIEWCRCLVQNKFEYPIGESFQSSFKWCLFHPRVQWVRGPYIVSLFDILSRVVELWFSSLVFHAQPLNVVVIWIISRLHCRTCYSIWSRHEAADEYETGGHGFSSATDSPLPRFLHEIAIFSSPRANQLFSFRTKISRMRLTSSRCPLVIINSGCRIAPGVS